jgi:hypothetical protein
MPIGEEAVDLLVSEEARTESLAVVVSLFRELFVDILGSLVPGILFTMFAAPMALWAGAEMLQGPIDWNKVYPFLAKPGYGPTLLILALSYVLGFICSRRDPKIPDQKSIAHILRKDWKSIDRAVVQPRLQKDIDEKAELDQIYGKPVLRLLNFRRIHRFTKGLAKSGGEFPYSHLSEYLTARGLDHLACHVPWKGTNNEISKRSKMFVNVLKIRIQQRNQRRSGEIIRNEAHVRMMSSVWFAAQELQWVCCGLALLLAVDSLYPGGWKPPFRFDPRISSFGGVLAALVALLIAATLLRVAIVRFLHYQRVREIVYVLETAHVFFRAGCTDIFEGFEDDEECARAVSSWTVLRVRDSRQGYRSPAR